jgi:HD-GYP domain-containing protein (c-di-GMP phosphodiesterase class II)
MFLSLVSFSILIFVILSTHDWTPALRSFLVWAGLIVAAELAPITLPKGGASLSVGGAIDFGIVLLFPTPLAAIGGAVSGLVNSISRGVELRKLLFNVSMDSITMAIASEIITKYGVKISYFPGLDISLWPLNRLLVPYIAAILAYYVLNTGLTSIAISISTGTPFFDIWRSNYLWTMASYLAMAPMGFVLATIYHVFYVSDPIFAILGLLIFIIPLIVIRSSFIWFINVNRTYFAAIRALTSALDASHHYTQGHSRRVAANAVTVAKALRLSARDIETIEQGAVLHDIGKIGMETGILDKEGPLSSIEWAKMKQHPILGSRIIAGLAFLRDANSIVVHHHERYDGKGYPTGLSGDLIPLGARIVNTVDSLDALTSNRAYRDALEREQAINILKANAGSQFDPEVIRVIEQLYQAGELIFQETDEIGDEELIFTISEVNEALEYVEKTGMGVNGSI